MEEKVILAALEEMKIHSFRFTMEDLARRLRMSKSSLYKVVSSKEELVHIIIDYLMASFEREKRNATSEDLAVEKQLERFIYSYTQAFRFFEDGIYNDLQMSYPKEWERWENFRQQQVDALMTLMEKGIGQGLFRPVNLSVIRRCILVMSSSLADSDFLRENDLTYAQAIDNMREWMFHGLCVK